MHTPNLHFNIIPFDWQNNYTIYLHRDRQLGQPRLHKRLYPHGVGTIFPGLKDRIEAFMGVSFSEPVEGFTPFVIDPKTENPDLVKRFYNRRIFEYFRYQCDRIVQSGFINENIVWVPAGGLNTADYWVFERFFLQVKLRTVSDGPELYISHQGQTKVLRKSVHEILE